MEANNYNFDVLLDYDHRPARLEIHTAKGDTTLEFTRPGIERIHRVPGLLLEHCPPDDAAASDNGKIVWL